MYVDYGVILNNTENKDWNAYVIKYVSAAVDPSAFLGLHFRIF